MCTSEQIRAFEDTYSCGQSQIYSPCEIAPFFSESCLESHMPDTPAMQVNNTQVNKVFFKSIKKSCRCRTYIHHYMHDKRIVNVNPEGQLNAVLRHAQINSFKLFHKQPKTQERKESVTCEFQESHLVRAWFCSDLLLEPTCSG